MRSLRLRSVFRDTPAAMVIPVAGATPAFLIGSVALLALSATLPSVSQAEISFSKILGIPPVTDGGGSRAVNWIDADGDGDLDLYVSNGGSVGENNVYYRNDGGTFVAEPGNEISNDGTRADGTTWGDTDNDGDPDLYVTNWYLERNAYFTNDGDGTFTRVTTGDQVVIPTYSESAAFVDPDQDGDLDLFVANSGNSSPQMNLYFENDGTGTFTRVLGVPIVTEGRFSRHGAWCDADLDGDLDLFVANEADQDNLFYRNELVETGTADLTPISLDPVTSDGGQSFGASWGDIDNDGDFDLFVANAYGQDNRLYRNLMIENGSLSFELITGLPSSDGGASIAGTWGDLDNDGDLDLFVGNGFHPDETTQFVNYVYENDGSGSFTRVDQGDLVTDLGWTYGAGLGDYDEDGDLDIFLANWFANDQDNALHRNEAQSEGRHWLTMHCEGTDSNRSAIGARLSVLATIDGLPVWQHRFISSQESYCGQNLRVHFGLGDATVVDSLVVRWPSGTIDRAADLGADQLLVLIEGGDVSSIDDSGSLPAPGENASGRVGDSLQLRVHPNPFGVEAEFWFALPEPMGVAWVVRDVGGRVLLRREVGRLDGGEHRVVWDGRDSAGELAPSGVYFVALEAAGEKNSVSRRVSLIR